jgi:PEP-CTERM motif
MNFGKSIRATGGATRALSALAVLAAFCLVNPSASAQLTTLTPGAPAVPVLTYTETGTQVGMASGTMSFGPIGASFTETVFKESGGTLNFDYVFTNTNTDGIASTVMSSFTGFTVAVAYSGNTVAPTSAALGSGTDAGVVTFNFSGLSSGQTTSTLIVSTNALAFGAGFVGVQDGSSAGANALAPTAVAAVPEPSSLAIAGIGALGLIGFGLRRRKAMGA